jgi:hypothetical protein
LQGTPGRCHTKPIAPPRENAHSTRENGPSKRSHEVVCRERIWGRSQSFGPNDIPQTLAECPVRSR